MNYQDYDTKYRDALKLVNQRFKEGPMVEERREKKKKNEYENDDIRAYYYDNITSFVHNHNNLMFIKNVEKKSGGKRYVKF